MANALYNSGRQHYLAGDGGFDTDTVKVVLVDSTYVFSQTHVSLADVLAGARLATSAALTTKDTTNGTADADDVVFSAVPTGDTATGFIVYIDTGVESTSTLICFCDTDAGGAISVPTNGSDITVTWNASGIFTL